MDEKEIAIKEAHMAEASDSYFDARQDFDEKVNRKMFDAGFLRGWGKARPIKPFGLTDTEISLIADKMPGGLDGFCKGWGWVQFARAIEEAHGIGD